MRTIMRKKIATQKFPSRKEETHERIVEVAARAIRRTGYSGFGVAPAGAVESSVEQAQAIFDTNFFGVVIEPAYTRTPFDANLLEPDAKLTAYDDMRNTVARRVQEAMARAEGPDVVAETVLVAARASKPKLRYTAVSLAKRLRLLRSFAPAGLVDAGLRKDLSLA
ncbi:MAG TPA: hypothetical protein VFS95_02570 [Telluria sp.]|nr:hypothetical protein [Telluria sp.]